MNNLFFLIPIALFLGGIGLAGFLWALGSGQYEDLDGAAERILIDEEASAARPSLPRGQEAE
ncbi:MAG: cytochrome oxidase maturation protein, cbb3-type [Rhizobiales bacterium 65-79]|jgi:cbb3-type cytochrome oxidase maturation protein|nr:cbb3-type cytochrome oxidase assembly protein CcoS [Hyphomicrobiales bacterium]OJU02983.1 MAG: cytochrome oxidase maturation protein, cbb3-type [Rhizobiales bacterium 65-79]